MWRCAPINQSQVSAVKDHLVSLRETRLDAKCICARLRLHRNRSDLHRWLHSLAFRGKARCTSAHRSARRLSERKKGWQGLLKIKASWETKSSVLAFACNLGWRVDETTPRISLPAIIDFLFSSLVPSPSFANPSLPPLSRSLRRKDAILFSSATLCGVYECAFA